jgi:hypothetical protein
MVRDLCDKSESSGHEMQSASGTFMDDEDFKVRSAVVSENKG